MSTHLTLRDFSGMSMFDLTRHSVQDSVVSMLFEDVAPRRRF
ncbi:hypothetical protein [Micromonospora sp. NPDC047074]